MDIGSSAGMGKYTHMDISTDVRAGISKGPGHSYRYKHKVWDKGQGKG